MATLVRETIFILNRMHKTKKIIFSGNMKNYKIYVFLLLPIIPKN